MQSRSRCSIMTNYKQIRGRQSHGSYWTKWHHINLSAIFSKTISKSFKKVVYKLVKTITTHSWYSFSLSQCSSKAQLPLLRGDGTAERGRGGKGEGTPNLEFRSQDVDPSWEEHIFNRSLNKKVTGKQNFFSSLLHSDFMMEVSFYK